MADIVEWKNLAVYGDTDMIQSQGKDAGMARDLRKAVHPISH